MVETWLRIGHQELLACNRNGRAERETLQTAQACSDLPNTNTDTGRYENRPRTHAKRLNRDSVVLGVGKPSERAEGRQKRETRLSPIVRTGRAILEVTSNLT